MVDLTLGDRVIDFGVNALHTDCDKIHVCSAVSATYADVVANTLGNKNFGTGNAFGAPAAGSVGRKVTSVGITDGAITANGTVSRWAAVDSVNSRLLAEGNLVGGAAVTSGEQFTLGAIVVRIPGTAGAGFATWDPASLGSSNSLSGGNLVVTNSATSNSWAYLTGSHNSGKYYLEITWTGASPGGVSGNTWISALQRSPSGAFSANFVVGQATAIDWNVAGSDSGVKNSYANTNDVVAVAIDLDNNLIWNRSDSDTRWNIDAAANPATGAGGANIAPALGSGFTGWLFQIFLQDNIGQIATVNTGQNAFHFAVPAGFGNW